jgi:hypothetical protein
MFGKLRLLPATASLSLLRKCGFKSGTINRNAALGSELNRKVNREAERVMQLEGHLPIKTWGVIRELIGANANRVHPLCEWRKRSGKKRRAAVERACELCLFALKGLHDDRFALAQVGICVGHDADHCPCNLRKKRTLDSEESAVTNGATDDAAQDVASPLIPRPYAIGEQEGHGA